jgi:hypothetical protein
MRDDDWDLSCSRQPRAPAGGTISSYDETQPKQDPLSFEHGAEHVARHAAG